MYKSIVTRKKNFNIYTSDFNKVVKSLSLSKIHNASHVKIVIKQKQLNAHKNFENCPKVRLKSENTDDGIKGSMPCMDDVKCYGCALPEVWIRVWWWRLKQID